MRLKIFTAYHDVSLPYVVTDLHVPVFSDPAAGELAAADPRVVDATVGDTIFHRPSFSDMRAQYFVWRNGAATGLDYVGFQQYRRALFLDTRALVTRHQVYRLLRQRTIQHWAQVPFYLAPDAWIAFLEAQKTLTDDDIRDIGDRVRGFDMLVTRPERQDPGVAPYYRQVLNAEHWDRFMSAVDAWYGLRDRPRLFNPDVNFLTFHSIYVLRTSLWHEYMSHWWDVMSALTPQITLSDDPWQSRTFGFLSERLFGFWVMQKAIEDPHLRIAHLPHLMPGS